MKLTWLDEEVQYLPARGIHGTGTVDSCKRESVCVCVCVRVRACVYMYTCM